MADFCINGLFLTQNITGIQRFAIELLSELDKLIGPETIEVAVPEKAEHTAVNWKNIKIVPTGGLHGIAWEQFCYAAYLRKTKKQGICLCNTVPLFHPGCVAVVHDINYKVNRQYFKGLRGTLSMLWHRLNYSVIMSRAPEIITVSEFSKKEICRVYHVSPQRIEVVYNAWQHLHSDPNVTKEEFHEQWPQLEIGNYWFSMASLMPNKNLDWILRAAQVNPTEQFALAGGGKLLEKEPLPSNVVHLGYVPDESVYPLMRNSKGFLFPTLYEGFGIPPIEAAACGAPIIAMSDIPCLREIYGDTVNYFDPHEAAPNLAGYRPISDDNRKNLLAQYSWEMSAEKMQTILNRMQERGSIQKQAMI